MGFLKFFIDLNLLFAHGPGIDLISNRNEYHGYLMDISWISPGVVKAVGALVWRSYHIHMQIIQKFWDPQTVATLAVYLDMCRNSFTFIF
jgi:hypothetical protein